MQREPSPDVPKLSASMRKGLLDLERKSRWLRRRDIPALQSVPKARKRRNKPGEERTLSNIVRDYKEAIERLEDIEAELSEWLVGPVVASSSRGSSSSDANAEEAMPPAVRDVEKTPDSLWTQPLD